VVFRSSFTDRKASGSVFGDKTSKGEKVATALVAAALRVPVLVG
jgi:hypothetical protein